MAGEITLTTLYIAFYDSFQFSVANWFVLFRTLAYSIDKNAFSL